jgi:hypothetical protein
MALGPAAKVAVRQATKRAARRKAAKKVARRTTRTATYVAKGAGTYTIRHVKRTARAGRRVAGAIRKKKTPDAADLLELIEGGAIYYTASKPVRRYNRNRRNRK